MFPFVWNLFYASQWPISASFLINLHLFRLEFSAQKWSLLTAVFCWTEMNLNTLNYLQDNNGPSSLKMKLQSRGLLLLTFHSQFHVIIMKEANVDPLKMAFRDLLVMDDVVSGRTVAMLIEFEFVTRQACNENKERASSRWNGCLGGLFYGP